MKQNDKPIPRSRMDRLMVENIMRDVFARVTGSRQAVVDGDGVMRLVDGKSLSIGDRLDGRPSISIVDDDRKICSVPVDSDDPEATVGLLVRLI